MTKASDKGERYYQGKSGIAVPWMRQHVERPDPPKPERTPIKIEVRRIIKLGIASTADIWLSGFENKRSSKHSVDKIIDLGQECFS